MTCAATLVAPPIQASAALRIIPPLSAALDVAPPDGSASPVLRQSLSARLRLNAPVMSGQNSRALSLSAILGRPLALTASAALDTSDGSLVPPAIALLPPGRCFAARPGSLLRRLLDGLLRELSRLLHRARRLLAQACPASSGELAIDWARVCGTSQIESRWRERGTLTRQRVLTLFPSVTGNAPVHATWTARQPFRAGASTAGHRLRPASVRFVVDLVLSSDAFADAAARETYVDACQDAFAFLARRWPPCAVLIVSLSDGSTLRVIRKFGVPS